MLSAKRIRNVDTDKRWEKYTSERDDRGQKVESIQSAESDSTGRNNTT